MYSDQALTCCGVSEIGGIEKRDWGIPLFHHINDTFTVDTDKDDWDDWDDKPPGLIVYYSIDDKIRDHLMKQFRFKRGPVFTNPIHDSTVTTLFLSRGTWFRHKKDIKEELKIKG